MSNIVPLNPLPEWLDAELWADFKQFRVELGLPLTPTAEKRALRKLAGFVERGGDAEAIIDYSIESNWRGLFYKEKDKEIPSYKDPKKLCEYGKSVGIAPRPGENYFEYRQRLAR